MRAMIVLTCAVCLLGSVPAQAWELDDDLETDLWTFARSNPNFPGTWVAAYSTAEAHSPTRSIRTYVAEGGVGGQDSNRSYGYRIFPLEGAVPETLSVWYNHQITGGSGAVLAYSRVQVIAKDEHGTNLESQVYAVTILDTDGVSPDYEFNANWIYQESRPEEYEPGAPDYSRAGNGSILPPVGWWYKLKVVPREDMDVDWSLVASLEVQLVSGGSYLFMNQHGSYWDDVSLQFPYRITSIRDVGNDQGRSVHMRWNAPGNNLSGPGPVVTSFSLWRKVEASLSGGAPFRTLGYPPGFWEFVLTMPAGAEMGYETVAPTLCDTTEAAGICWSRFFVRAHTADPLVYYDTEPDSGYSVDNLAPSIPAGLMVLSPPSLAWEDVPDEDFDYYAVYGSDDATFDGTATLLGYTVAAGYDISHHPHPYYHVTATDFSGNQGQAASTMAPVAVPEPGIVPARFQLHPNQPNPFRSTTVVTFDLPRPEHARVLVVDVKGRLVATVLDGSLPEGRYTLRWDGRNDQGTLVPPGAYFLNLRAGTFSQTAKMVRVN